MVSVTPGLCVRTACKRMFLHTLQRHSGTLITCRPSNDGASEAVVYYKDPVGLETVVQAIGFECNDEKALECPLEFSIQDLRVSDEWESIVPLGYHSKILHTCTLYSWVPGCKEPQLTGVLRNVTLLDALRGSKPGVSVMLHDDPSIGWVNLNRSTAVGSSSSVAVCMGALRV